MLVLAAASSAILLTVVGQCGRNIIQAREIRKLAIGNPLENLKRLPIEDSLASSPGSDASPAERLRAMNREDLLKVFANSRAPTPSELGEWSRGESQRSDFCDWEGTLLDNNSVVFDFPSFISHVLFGGIGLPWRLMGESRRAKGRWVGKAFAKPTSVNAGRGINLFAGRDAKNKPSAFQRHSFDYNIVKSKVLPGNDSYSLLLDYSKYQSLPISLWSSMKDELRVVETCSSSSTNDNGENTTLLIGMGWMGWSGGPLNCSPFMLERRCN